MRTTKETVISLDDGDTLRIEGEGSFATVKIGGAGFVISFDPDRSSKPIIDNLRTGDAILTPNGEAFLGTVDVPAEPPYGEFLGYAEGNDDLVIVNITEETSFTIFAL